MNYKITRDKFFSEKQMQTILKTCDDMADLDNLRGRITWPVRRMLVRLAFYSGLRVAELANLKIKDLVLDEGDPYIFVRHGKGDKSRDVYISPELAKELKGFIKMKKTWEQSTDLEAPVFTGRGGEHFTSTALTLSFTQAVKRSGLPWEAGKKAKGEKLNLSIHSARHTYATLLYKNTGNLRYVQKQLGHTSLNITALYADILPEENGKLARMLPYQ